MGPRQRRICANSRAILWVSFVESRPVNPSPLPHPHDRQLEGWPDWSILVVDDEPGMLSFLVKTLAPRCHFVMNASTAEDGAQWLRGHHVDLIILDISLPGKNGVTWLKELREHGYTGEVILITAFADLDTAIEALRAGASDFILKPFRVPQILNAVKQCHERAKLKRENFVLRRAVAHSPGQGPGLIGGSDRMQRLRAWIDRVAVVDSTVLLQGESGTGKELVARALHNLSRRAKAPMISVNCAAIPETLIESELFGHEKGAFTGASAGRAGLVEAADGGTLFLDEIGELPLEAQARLLRVLQEGEIRRVGSVQSQKVDVRLIAATHRDLKSLAKIGQFREDLYYRLHVIALKLPALRERGADVNEIANAFLARQSARINRTDLKFAPDAEQAIRHYSWPGNVRELENAVERAVILSESPEISADLLGIDIELSDLEEDEFIGLAPQQGSTSNASHEPTEDLSLEDYFQHFVLEHQDHMTETELARKLGVSRKCLWERRQRLGIPRRKTGVTSES